MRYIEWSNTIWQYDPNSNPNLNPNPNPNPNLTSRYQGTMKVQSIVVLSPIIDKFDI